MGYHPPASDKDQLKIKLIIANEDSTKYVGYITPDGTGSFILKNYEHPGTSKNVFFEVVDMKNLQTVRLGAIYEDIDGYRSNSP